jgi:ADP-ribosylglycohydrolase
MSNDLRITNGAAMKVAPAGWANPGDLNAAVRAACSICIPTHNTDVAFSGAAAVAGSVAVAAAGGNLGEVLEASVDAARLGRRIGLAEAFEVPAPDMASRLALALDVAAAKGSREERIGWLNALIGPGLPITEAVPMAVGAVAVIPDDPMELIRVIVNLGGDSDTVAAIAGAIAGTMGGIDALDADMVATLERVNGLDIRQIGRRAAAAAADRAGGDGPEATAADCAPEPGL